MPKSLLCAFSSLLIFCSIGYAQESDEPKGYAENSQEPEQSKYRGLNPRPFRVALRHIEGKGIGYPCGYTSLDLAMSPYIDDFKILPVIDVRTHLFDDGKFAFNAGVIGRYHRRCTVFGMNVYYDYRNAQHARYNQVGGGLEALGERWDFRMNGYLPFGIKHSPFYAIKLEGLTLVGREELALKGLDFEVGVHTKCRDPWGFYSGVIPYCYGAKGMNAWGGKIRLLAQWKDYITLEVDGSYDSLFHGIVQGQISFNIPFGTKKPTVHPADWKPRMVEPVLRSEIIAARHRHAKV